MLTALVVFAVAIVLALAFYAYHLTGKVKQQEAEAAELEAQKAKAEAEKKEYLLESLRIISAAALNDELTLSEAVIRCKMLLEGLVITEEEWLKYDVLKTVFEKVSQFDTHQARKDLSRDERKAQDKAREAIEREFKDSVHECFKKLTTIS